MFSEDGEVSYYLPEGTWTHLLNGETVEGGKWRKETYDFMSLPLFVRQNSILALGANDLRPDYDFADGVDLGLYRLQQGVQVTRTVRNVKGETDLAVAVVREGSKVSLKAEGAGKAFKVSLHGMGEAASVEGGNLGNNGIIEVPAFNGKVELQITLK
ncbi:Alpha-xylosidase [compost metagenome]